MAWYEYILSGIGIVGLVLITLMFAYMGAFGSFIQRIVQNLLDR